MPFKPGVCRGGCKPNLRGAHLLPQIIKLMLDVSNRLSSIESKLDLLMRESQRDRKLQNGSGP